MRVSVAVVVTLTHHHTQYLIELLLPRLLLRVFLRLVPLLGRQRVNLPLEAASCLPVYLRVTN